jgi:iron(III) transport system substrate-binding protein
MAIVESRMLVAVATGAVALAASIAPALAQPKTVAEIANYTGPDRQKILEDGARREGSLMLYATGTQIQPLLDRFKQKYPFIKLEMPRASSADTARQIYEEYSAGVYNVDAFELSSYGLVPIRDMGFLQPFKTPEAVNYVASAIEPGGRWISVREGYIGIGYNPKVIKPEDAPKTYQDLLDPKWKGKMAISSSASTASTWMGAMLVTYGEAFVRRFADMDVRLYNVTGRALANLTISGEAPLVPTTYQSHVEASQKQGASIEWNLPGPVPVTDTAAAIATRAPHPHAAMLLIDFLASKEAQLLYKELGYYSSHKDLAANQIPGIQKLFLTNRPKFVEEFESWTALTQQIFSKSGKLGR